MACKIAIAEDSDTDAALLERALQHTQCPVEVTRFRNGSELISYLAARNTRDLPHLVVLDLHMPEMGGFQTLAWIRNEMRAANLPVVILSSSDSPEDLDTARQLRCSEYIVKDPGWTVFRERIEGMIERFCATCISKRREATN